MSKDSVTTPNALVGQWIGHRISNSDVEGSSPSECANSTVSRTLAADTNDSRKAENSNVAADRDERGRFAKKQISTFNVSDNFDDSVFHPRENSRASFDRGYAEGESDGFMSGCVFTSVVIVAAALFFWFLCRNGVLG